MFKYRTGERVLAGDRVRTLDGDATVVLVIEPGTEAATDYSCARGGILYRVGDRPNCGLILESSPDPDEWDLEFICRGDVPADWPGAKT